jgi:hypothetical protein
MRTINISKLEIDQGETVERETLIFPPRFRFNDTKEEVQKRNEIWNSYLDVTPNTNPLNAIYTRHNFKPLTKVESISRSSRENSLENR